MPISLARPALAHQWQPAAAAAGAVYSSQSLEIPVRINTPSMAAVVRCLTQPHDNAEHPHTAREQGTHVLFMNT